MSSQRQGDAPRYGLTPLVWDSEHFGFRVARLSGTDLDDAELAAALGEASRRASAWSAGQPTTDVTFPSRSSVHLAASWPISKRRIGQTTCPPWWNAASVSGRHSGSSPYPAATPPRTCSRWPSPPVRSRGSGPIR